jgi:predicted metal-dependent hydrolase
MISKSITSKQLYHYGDQKLEYTLVKSRRRKTSEVIVDKNEITLRIPFHKSMSDVEKLMTSKIRWINKKQKEYRERIPEIIKPNFMKGSTVPYLGKNYEIDIIKYSNNDDDKIEFNGRFIVRFGFQKDSDESKYNSRIKSLYEDWLADRSEEMFKNKVIEFSKILKVTPRKIIVKNLKNRWGSLTKNKTINLNLNLMKAPEDVIDYIIIHELCHFKIKGHSHKFWSYLHRYVPNYHDKIDWLAINGSNILS